MAMATMTVAMSMTVVLVVHVMVRIVVQTGGWLEGEHVGAFRGGLVCSNARLRPSMGVPMLRSRCIRTRRKCSPMVVIARVAPTTAGRTALVFDKLILRQCDVAHNWTLAIELVQ